MLGVIASEGTWKDVVSAAARPLKIRAAGKWMVTLLGLFNPTLREFKELMYEFEAPYVVDHSQYEAAFGNNTTPHAETIAETVAWYKSRV